MLRRLSIAVLLTLALAGCNFKHNLNARAIGSLKGTATSINTDVATLIKSIDNSMQEADKLISSLDKADKG
jgi:hypothetical protein